MTIGQLGQAYMECRESLFQTAVALAKEYRRQKDLDGRRTWSGRQAEADMVFIVCLRAIDWPTDALPDVERLLAALDALRQTRVSQADAGTVADYNDLVKDEIPRGRAAHDAQDTLRGYLGLPPIRPFWRSAGDEVFLAE